MTDELTIPDFPDAPAPPTTMATKLLEVGTMWSEAFNGVKRFEEFTLGQHYFGRVQLHHSLMKEENQLGHRPLTIKPDNLPPLSKMLGSIHVIFRDTLHDRLGIYLDEEKLNEETRHHIETFDRIIRQWRQMVLDTRKEKDGTTLKYKIPDSTKVDEEKASKMDADCLLVTNALDASSLASSQSAFHPTIPVRIGGVRKAVSVEGDKTVRYIIEGGKAINIPNKNDIGLLLFGIPRVRRQATDLNKVPFNIASWLGNNTGNASLILSNMQRKFQREDLLREPYEAVCAECYKDILALVQIPENTHALQMANLIILDKEYKGFKNLLNETHQPEFPAELHSLEECALIVDAIIIRQMHNDPIKSTHWRQSILYRNFSRECLTTADGKGNIQLSTLKLITKEVMDTVAMPVDILDISDATPEEKAWAIQQRTRQVELVKAYLGIDKLVWHPRPGSTWER